MLDGVYACREEGVAPVFVPAPPLRDDDVQRIGETAAHRLVRLLPQRGVLDEAVGDALAEKEPLLAALSAASIQGQLATGPRAGRLQCIEADHLTFRLTPPWSDGTTQLLLSPLELIEKLRALIPPPRLNLMRDGGHSRAQCRSSQPGRTPPPPHRFKVRLSPNSLHRKPPFSPSGPSVVVHRRIYSG